MSLIIDNLITAIEYDNDYLIQIYRGTSYSLSIQIFDKDGTEFELGDNDKIIFGVKSSVNVDSENYIIKKILTLNDKTKDGYILNLTPEDTDLLPTTYAYDIGVQFSNGDYQIVIPPIDYQLKGNFRVKGTVTKKEIEDANT